MIAPRRAATAFAVAALAVVACASALLFAAPQRPSLEWPSTKLYGNDYVSLREVAERYGMKLRWVKSGSVMRLSGSEAVEFERHKRDVHIDGVRVFLGSPVVAYRGSLWVAQDDLIKTLTPVLRPEAVAAFLPSRPKVIVLDPGHGGNDPGKQNMRHKLDEKDMTLDVARRLRRLLESSGFSVKMTREDDSRLADSQSEDLQKRADFANRAGADLFVSIHFNAVDPKDADRVTGSESFVLTPQYQLSTADSRKDGMTDVYYPGNRQDTANALAGFHMHKRLIKDLKTSDRGYKRARFSVLRFLDCPGVLLEAAYLSNDDEAKRVGLADFRQEIAESMARGIRSYADELAKIESRKKD